MVSTSTSFSKLAKASTLALLTAAAFSASAQTAPAFYGELGYTALSYSESGYKADPGMLRAVVGTEIHPNLNVEGMLGVGIKDGSTRVSNVNISSQVDRFWGVYLKPKVMLTPDIELFGRVGYASSKVTASVPGYAISDSGNSMSYGVGLNFKVAANTTLNADFMSYYDKNGVKATGLTVGVGFKF